jgi:hypothetical protein
MQAYHFTGNTLRDGRPVPPVGEKLAFDGELVLCECGLHASLQPFDALQYAPGPMLHLVECGGTVLHQDDKLVCTERTILKSIDATQILRRFAADQALSVAHLWNMPPIVREYLETLDEGKRAEAAARAADRAAARAAARAADAAWAAARAAVWAADRAAFNKMVNTHFPRGSSTMDKTEPTAAAMRVSQDIFGTFQGQSNVQEAIEIDRMTGLSELITACDHFCRWVEQNAELVDGCMYLRGLAEPDLQLAADSGRDALRIARQGRK